MNKQPINANVTSDTGIFDIDFDATPFFTSLLEKGSEATERFAERLAGDRFGSGFASDEIAEHFFGYTGDNETYQQIAEMFVHNGKLPAHIDERGFSVSVEQEDVINWLSTAGLNEIAEKLS